MASYPSWFFWLFLNGHYLYIRISVANTPLIRSVELHISGHYWMWLGTQSIDRRGYFAKIKNESPSIFPLQSYTNQRILSISFSSIAFNVIPLQENLWQVLPNIYIQRIDVRLLNFDNKSFLGSQSDILQASLTKSHLLLYLSVSVSPLCLSATATWSRFII